MEREWAHALLLRPSPKTSPNALDVSRLRAGPGLAAEHPVGSFWPASVDPLALPLTEKINERAV
jgi:hypothetical protein